MAIVRATEKDYSLRRRTGTRETEREKPYCYGGYVGIGGGSSEIGRG